jgi:hypothetical protein
MLLYSENTGKSGCFGAACSEWLATALLAAPLKSFCE